VKTRRSNLYNDIGVVSLARSCERLEENARAVVLSTYSTVQFSSSIPGLSVGCSLPRGSSNVLVASCRACCVVDDVKVSHVRRRESISRARLGKLCLRIYSIHCKRSIVSLNEVAMSGARLSTVAGATENSHCRRKWRQRLHGMPSSHFSLRRRHSAQLRDGCQSKLCLPCLSS